MKIIKFALDKPIYIICSYRQITPLTFDPNTEEELQMEPVILKHDQPSSSKQVLRQCFLSIYVMKRKRDRERE